MVFLGGWYLLRTALMPSSVTWTEGTSSSLCMTQNWKKQLMHREGRVLCWDIQTSKRNGLSRTSWNWTRTMPHPATGEKHTIYQNRLRTNSLGTTLQDKVCGPYRQQVAHRSAVCSYKNENMYLGALTKKSAIMLRQRIIPFYLALVIFDKTPRDLFYCVFSYSCVKWFHNSYI